METIKEGCIAIILFVLVICSCCNGLFSSGTWEDDPRNWDRAFHTSQPEDVVIIHSYYWRSSHFTEEYQYFFEIEPNQKILEQLISEHELVLVEGEDAEYAINDYFSEKPPWFVPKGAESYEIYAVPGSDPSTIKSHFKVFIDKDTGNIFINNHQV